MRTQAKRIYSKDQEYLVKLREEYTLYGGFETSLERGVLIIWPRKKGDGQAKAKREAAKRKKRARNRR